MTNMKVWNKSDAYFSKYVIGLIILIKTYFKIGFHLVVTGIKKNVISCQPFFVFLYH